MSLQKNDKVNHILKMIAGGTLWADTPVGTINAYGGTTAPDGWMLCQGQAISRTDYADLFAIIGTAFGTGDGSTTFNVPDLRGEFLRGAGTNSHSGEGNGGIVGQHQNATRIIATDSDGAGTTNALGTAMENAMAGPLNADAQDNYQTKRGYVNLTAYNTTGSLRIAVRPTNTSVNYIIKAKQTPLPTDIAEGLEALLAEKSYLAFE